MINNINDAKNMHNVGMDMKNIFFFANHGIGVTSLCSMHLKPVPLSDIDFVHIGQL